MPDKPAPRKKSRSAKPIQIIPTQAGKQDDAHEEEVSPDEANAGEAQIAFTPIKVLQNVGHALQIPPEEFSVEKLKASPAASKKKKAHNDKKAN